MSKVRFSLLATGVVAASLALSACASGATPVAPSASSQQFSSADVTFASEMAAHHQQAIEMSQLVLDKPGIDPRVTALAKEIQAAQGAEIKQMTNWLADWGQKDHTMSGMDMSGSLMSDADMKALTSSSGIAASRLYLVQMAAHHASAISMATTEIDKGRYPAALTLAKKIVRTQTNEIATMSGILNSLKD